MWFEGDEGRKGSPARIGGSGSPNVVRTGEPGPNVVLTGDEREGKVVERVNVNEDRLELCPWPSEELDNPWLRLMDVGMGGTVEVGDVLCSLPGACCLANDDAIDPLRPRAP